MKNLDEHGEGGAQRQLFERAVQGLDLGAANRLRLARRAAQAHGAGAAVGRRAWAPALATAALLVLGLAWWLPQRSPAPAPTARAPVARAAVPDATDASDLVVESEDADLYAWLGEAPVAAETDPEQAL
jgi:hypothetical protein